MHKLKSTYGLCSFHLLPFMSSPRPRRPFPLVLLRYRSRSSSTSSVRSDLSSTPPSAIAFAPRRSDASSFLDDVGRCSLATYTMVGEGRPAPSHLHSHVETVSSLLGDGNG